MFDACLSRECRISTICTDFRGGNRTQHTYSQPNTKNNHSYPSGPEAYLVGRMALYRHLRGRHLDQLLLQSDLLLSQVLLTQLLVAKLLLLRQMQTHLLLVDLLLLLLLLRVE